MSGPRIQVDTEVMDIYLKPFQTLTVWLGGLQVELRVLGDGTPEIYADQIELRSFNAWKSVSGGEHG